MKFPLKKVYSVHNEGSPGGGASYTFGDGLTLVDSNVSAGGSFTFISFEGGAFSEFYAFAEILAVGSTTALGGWSIGNSIGGGSAGSGHVSIEKVPGVDADLYLNDFRTNPRGLQEFSDYSSGYTALSHVNKSYADGFLGGQPLDAAVISPGAGQDGFVLSWNQANQEYELVSGGGGISNSGANNQIVKSDGTNLVGTGLTSPSSGVLWIGGSPSMSFTASTQTITGGSLGSGFNLIANNGALGLGQDGENITFTAGNGSVGGNNNGGNVIIKGGNASGAGSPGAVAINQVFKTISVDNYAFDISDWGKILVFTSVNPITVTLPNGLSDGFQAALARDTGAGVITVSATTTLKSAGTQIVVSEAMASVSHRGANVWWASGLS